MFDCLKFAGKSLLAFTAMAAIAVPATAANISGKVTYEGEPPKRQAIKMDADPACAALHEKPVGTVDALVRPDTKEVIFAFVYLEGEGLSGEAPAEHAKIDQTGCMYEPHVQGIMVGQTLDIVNSDPTMHNIHCLAEENREFNFGQPTPGTREEVFRRPEIGVKFKCDVHPWMSAYIHVMEHPYFATTGSHGEWTIENVPAGTYKLKTWHEKFGETEQEITVADTDVEGVEIKIPAAEKQ